MDIINISINKRSIFHYKASYVSDSRKPTESISRRPLLFEIKKWNCNASTAILDFKHELLTL